MRKTQQTQTYTEWLGSYPAASTRSLYHSATSSFLQTVYDKATSAEDLAKTYIEQAKAGKRDYIADLLKFINAIKERPPKSIKTYATGVIQFLLYCCDIDLSTKERKMLRLRMPKGNKARTREDDLTRDKIRQLLTHCDVRMRALILLLVSTGLRIGEALQLRVDDVTLDAIPPVVYVRGETTKEGDYYIGFLMNEATEAVKEWLKVRDNYILDAARRTKNISHSKGRNHKVWSREATPPNEGFLFPFGSTSTRNLFRKILRRAGLYSQDPTTRVSSIHPHSFRKFFLSQVKAKGMPDAVAETLVGHKTYLSDSYRRYTTQQLAEEFRKVESALYIFQDSKPIQQLDERTKQFDEVMRRNNALVAELENLKADHAKVMAAFKNLPRLLGIEGKWAEIDILDTDTIELMPPAEDVKAAPVPKSKRAS
jgi:integrase